MRLPSIWSALAATLAGALASGPGAAQAPADPLRVIVPFAAGGPADQIACIVQAPLGAALGRGVAIDRRGGAGSTRSRDQAGFRAE